MQDWGGAAFRWTDEAGKPTAGTTIWSIGDAAGDAFAPSKSSFMINPRRRPARFAAGAAQRGMQRSRQDGRLEYGKFGWVIDPEGNKVELWQPPEGLRPSSRQPPQDQPGTAMCELAAADAPILVLVDNVTDNLSSPRIRGERGRFWRRGGRRLPAAPQVARRTDCLAPSLHGVATSRRRSCSTPGPTRRCSRETSSDSVSTWVRSTESFSPTDTGITAAPCSVRWR